MIFKTFNRSFDSRDYFHSAPNSIDLPVVLIEIWSAILIVKLIWSAQLTCCLRFVKGTTNSQCLQVWSNIWCALITYKCRIVEWMKPTNKEFIEIALRANSHVSTICYISSNNFFVINRSKDFSRQLLTSKCKLLSRSNNALGWTKWYEWHQGYSKWQYNGLMKIARES